MHNLLPVSSLLEFLKKGEVEAKVERIDALRGVEHLAVCPADKPPADSSPYIIFVGRTAKDPVALMRNSKATVVVLDNAIAAPPETTGCIIRVDNARLFFCELLAYVDSDQAPTISAKASVAPSAKIGQRVSIGDYTVIGEDVVIGDDTSIANNVSIGDRVQIGCRTRISPGTVIGTAGFGYEKRPDGTNIRFPHIGAVRIGNDVEIGANTAIDRGTLSDTIIEDNAKIDNLVHIAHNVQIGPNSLVIANAMVAGGVKVGPNSWIGPSANILDGITVGNDSFVGIAVTVLRDLPSNSKFTLRNFLKLFS